MTTMTTDRYGDPITSPSDLAFYESLTEVMREDMRSEFGTFATKVDGREVLIGGEDGVGECFCADCDGYSECGAIIYNLRWEGDDLPAWDEDGERVCISCGMTDLYNDDGEALEAGRQAEAERQWEARREEGLV